MKNTPSQPVNYDEFIAGKVKRHDTHGFEPYEIKAPLFEWQKHVVRWAIKTGRASLFEDCGLGKTLQQLEWASQVATHTRKPVLVLTPLAVAHQTCEEADRFGYVGVRVAASTEDLTKGVRIAVTNYEKLKHFDVSRFGGVVLDESSILKNFTGQMRRQLCPLQLDVIERAVELWSNPGDVVYSPFVGIGSEGYQALKMGRKFIGSELKESYFNQACANLKNATSQSELFLRAV